MARTDSCGCVIDRKYASDFLVKRLYANGRGKEVCSVKIDGTRWFRLYRDNGAVTYRASECPVLVITLEALCEAYEEGGGRIDLQTALEKLRSVKGFQVTELVRKIAEEFLGCLS